MVSPFLIKRGITYLMVLIIIGIGAGLGGVLLTYLLHEVQHLTFGYSLNTLISHESFTDGLMNASPERRFWGVVIAGIVAMVGGMLFRTYANAYKGVNQAMSQPEKAMPIVTTIASALLQIVTVAMGSPLGRESAPREVGAMIASQWTRKVATSVFFSHSQGQTPLLSPGEISELIACGAGAGLAAVYNVPLAGALFTLEVLLRRISTRLVLSALITSGVAAYTATFGLGTTPLYSFHDTSSALPLIVLCLVLSPVIGGVAYLFRQLCGWATHCAKYCHHLPFFCLLGFLLVAIIAIWLPQIPGNGRGILQIGLNANASLGLALSLLIFKTLSVVFVLRGGVKGGIMTPSLAIGGILGSILFILLQNILPLDGMSGYVISSAAGFLAAAMHMPLTAVLMAIELTHVPARLMLPILINGVASYWICHWLENRKGKSMLVHSSSSL